MQSSNLLDLVVVTTSIDEKNYYHIRRAKQILTSLGVEPLLLFVFPFWITMLIIGNFVSFCFARWKSFLWPHWLPVDFWHHFEFAQRFSGWRTETLQIFLDRGNTYGINMSPPCHSFKRRERYYSTLSFRPISSDKWDPNKEFFKHAPGWFVRLYPQTFTVIDHQIVTKRWYVPYYYTYSIKK